MELPPRATLGFMIPASGPRTDTQPRSKPMATTERAVKRTYEDYCRAADDKRYELLNGDLMIDRCGETTAETTARRL